MENIKGAKGALSARQLNILQVNLSLMPPADLTMMHLLIDAYCWHDYSLEYLVDHVTSLLPDLANIVMLVFQQLKVRERNVVCQKELYERKARKFYISWTFRLRT